MKCIKKYVIYKGYIQEISKSETIITKNVNSKTIQRLRIHFWNSNKTHTLSIDYDISDYIQFKRNYNLEELGI